jgi:hypothetical protein
MSNQTANTQTTNIVPVQGTFEPLYPYNIISFIGPAGLPFYAPTNPNLDGVTITNSTINSTTIGVTTPAAGAFTTASATSLPVGGNDLTNKTYVDAALAGISWKEPVRAATLANITLSGAQTIDGVAVVAGERVLVKDQSTAADNGIYVVGTPWTRAPDANTWDELVSALVFVESGSLGGSAWYCYIQPGGTLGVTAVNWSNFQVAGAYFAGTGLTLASNIFSITNTGVSAATYGSATTTPAIAVNAQGQITSATNTTITPAIGSITGLGTGVATALAINTGSVGSVLVNGGPLGTPASGDFTSGTFTWPTFNQNTTGTAAGLSTTLAIGSGGTGQTTASAAFNALSPITTTGDLIIGNGSNSATRLGIGANNTVLTSNGTTASWVSSSGFMVYPGAGIPNSTGSAWGTSYSTTGTGTVVALATAPTLNNPIISNYMDFSNGSATTLAAGRMWYNGTTGSWNLGMGNGNITQQVGEELYRYGKASAAITDSPLQLVYKTGVVGASDVITFAPAVAGITRGDDILGCATESIANNSFGRITTYGIVNNITTNGSAYGETWADNDDIYYNPTTGGLTKNLPTAPGLKLLVGTVINAGSGGSGSFIVKLGVATYLSALSDVQLSSSTGGQLLSYNQTGGYWKNTSITAGTGITVTPTAGGDVTIASTVTSGVTITDDTTTNATRYITFSNVTTGNETTLDVSSTKLQFNPSTGVLTTTGANLTGLTASSAVATDASKNLVSVTNTGSGNNVLATSPTLTTPNIGAATATSVNGLTITSSTGTLTVTNGKTLSASNTLTLAGTDSTTMTFPSTSSSIGYLNIPQSGSDKTTSYTLALGDIGEFVGVGSGGSITIPNSTFAAGDAVSIFNNTTGNITITCTITTAYIAGTDTDKATVTLATRGVCTVLFISGTVCVLTGNVS